MSQVPPPRNPRPNIRRSNANPVNRAHREALRLESGAGLKRRGIRPSRKHMLMHHTTESQANRNYNKWRNVIHESAFSWIFVKRVIIKGSKKGLPWQHMVYPGQKFVKISILMSLWIFNSRYQPGSIGFFNIEIETFVSFYCVMLFLVL